MTLASNILAFDFGTRSIGVAIGQCVTCTARPLTVFKARAGIPNWQQIEKLLNEWRSETVVVGLPLNMDGSEQPVTTQARKFANRLHVRFGIKVILHDERLTTIEARASLFKCGGYKVLEKSNVDATSAAIILVSWLEQFSK